MEELCFDLSINENQIINEDFLMDSLISFAVNNNIYIGGGVSSGFCLYPVNKNSHTTIKKSLLDYIYNNHRNELEAVVFKNYKDNLDDFIVEEKVFINK